MEPDHRRGGELPLVYSCSGCSNIAQVTNQVAVALDRAGVAEMSCIAGVGGGVKPLVAKARSGRPVIALDGCALHCVAHCLDRHGVKPARHYTLTEHGLKKRFHTDCAPDDIARIERLVRADLDFDRDAPQRLLAGGE